MHSNIMNNHIDKTTPPECSRRYSYTKQPVLCSDPILTDSSLVLAEPGGRGQGQPRAADREGGDRQLGPLAHGQPQSAGPRLQRRQRETEQPLLRHHQPQLRLEAGGRRHYVRKGFALSKPVMQLLNNCRCFGCFSTRNFKKISNLRQYFCKT